MRWSFKRCPRCTAHFVPTDTNPDHCSSCTALLATRAVADPIEPVKRYELTGGDERFLKSLRIAAD